MPMHEHRKVAGGEGRLGMRDRVQRERGPGEQFLAIAPRNLGMLGKPIGCEPLPRHPCRSRADLVLRF